MKFQIAVCALICALAACNSSSSLNNSPLPAANAPGGAGAVAPESVAPGLSQRTCEGRVNDTLTKLEQCIRQGWLWHHLSRFQHIANQNPDQGGHGNRDTGTPGYKASVDYVAGLMRRAGYNVTIQQYGYKRSEVIGTPEFGTASRRYAIGRDWFVARRSGSGTVTAPIEPPNGASSGCSAADFAGFSRGRIALIERGACMLDLQVANARAAGAAAVIIYDGRPERGAYPARLVEPAEIPVAGVATYAVGDELLRQYRSGSVPKVHLEIRQRALSGIDYNVIADSPYGNPRRVVVIDAHLDSIFGAGMLDNASGSTTNLEVALSLAKTPTRNRLRFIWFGGEELGLLGSQYYTTHLTQSELHKIAFDVDVDVTATPNFDVLIADPKNAFEHNEFPPNVIPGSKIGNDYFADFFEAAGVVSRPCPFGNDGTDSLSFAFAGVPDTGILTMQDCCKESWETALWGGFLGNYEGTVPGYDGGCADRPDRWCDNLSNNDPFMLELVSKAVAYVTFELANRHHFRR